MIILCILSEYHGNNTAFYRILNNYLYLCSRDFLLTLVQQIKSSKIINGMAKVSIICENHGRFRKVSSKVLKV